MEQRLCLECLQHLFIVRLKNGSFVIEQKRECFLHLNSRINEI